MKKSILFGAAMISLALASCGGGNEEPPHVTRIEAAYLLEGSTEERIAPYSITYGENFKNMTFKVYGYWSDNTKKEIPFKNDQHQDGFTYHFTVGTEEEFLSNKPNCGTYGIEFNYLTHMCPMAFIVNRSSQTPDNVFIDIGSSTTFRYDESKPNPVLRGFDGQLDTYVNYEYAPVDELGEISGPYLGYDQQSNVYPGKYRLKGTISSCNYDTFEVFKDFEMTKGTFPSSLCYFDTENVVNFAYVYNKTTLGDYQLTTLDTPEMKDVSTHDPLSLFDNSSFRWETPNQPVLTTDNIVTSLIYSCDLYEDYVIENYQLSFNKQLVSEPYNFMVLDANNQPTETINSATYDGREYHLSWESIYSDLSEEECPFEVKDGSDLAKTNAGIYHVTFSLKDKTNTQWSSGGTDDIVTEWIISPASLLTTAYETKFVAGETELSSDDTNYFEYGSYHLNDEFKVLVKWTENDEPVEFPAIFTANEYQNITIENNVLTSIPTEFPALPTFVDVALLNNSNYALPSGFGINIQFLSNPAKHLFMDKNSYDGTTIDGTRFDISSIFPCDQIERTSDYLVKLEEDNGFKLEVTNSSSYLKSISNVAVTVEGHKTGQLLVYYLDTVTFETLLEENPDTSMMSGSNCFLLDGEFSGDNTVYSKNFDTSVFKEDKDYLVAFHFVANNHETPDWINVISVESNVTVIPL